MTDVEGKLGMSLDDIMKRTAKPKPGKFAAAKGAPPQNNNRAEPAELNMSLDDVVKSRARSAKAPPGKLTAAPAGAGGRGAGPGGRGAAGRGAAGRGRGGRHAGAGAQRVVEPIAAARQQQKDGAAKQPGAGLRIQASFTSTKPTGQRQVVNAKRNEHAIVYPNSGNAAYQASSKQGHRSTTLVEVKNVPRAAPKRSVHDRIAAAPLASYSPPTHHKQYQEPPLDYYGAAPPGGYHHHHAQDSAYRAPAGYDPHHAHAHDEEYYADEDAYYDDDAYPPAKHARRQSPGGPRAAPSSRHHACGGAAIDDLPLSAGAPPHDTRRDARDTRGNAPQHQQQARHAAARNSNDHRGGAKANGGGPAPRASHHTAQPRRDPSPRPRSRTQPKHDDNSARAPRRRDASPAPAAGSALDAMELLQHPTMRDLSVKLGTTIVATVTALDGMCTVLPYGGARTTDVFECLQAVLLALSCALVPGSDSVRSGDWRIVGPGGQQRVGDATIVAKTNGARAPQVFDILSGLQGGGGGGGQGGAVQGGADSRQAAQQAATLASTMVARQQGILPNAGVVAAQQQQQAQQALHHQQQQFQLLQQQQQVQLQQQQAALQQQQQQQPQMLFAQVQQQQPPQQQQQQHPQQVAAAPSNGFVPMQLGVPAGMVNVDSMGMGQQRDSANGRPAAQQGYAPY